jgi:subtilisin family serine protease
MAAPHVAGVCALALEASPSATPAQVRATLAAALSPPGIVSARL